MDDCLVCRELRGEFELPGGLLVDDGLVAAFHVAPIEDRLKPVYLGHLLVVTRRHVDHLGDLTDDEAARVAVVARRLGAALRASEGVERVHLALIGTGVPHFHLHVFPRYPGTPPELRWTEIDEWEGAPRGATTGVAALAERIRPHL